VQTSFNFLVCCSCGVLWQQTMLQNLPMNVLLEPAAVRPTLCHIVSALMKVLVVLQSRAPVHVDVGMGVRSKLRKTRVKVQNYQEKYGPSECTVIYTIKSEDHWKLLSLKSGSPYPSRRTHPSYVSVAKRMLIPMLCQAAGRR
jgi:hypothetical protein